MRQVDVKELEHRLAPIGATGIRPLAGGASSLTFAGSVGDGGEKVVVKVAPPGVPPVLNRDVLRQARMLRALGPTAVPVPDVIWEDPGEPPEIPPLFVMRFVAGTSFEPLFDRDGGDDGGDDGDHDDKVVPEALRQAAAVMAALHALDPDALGFGSEPRVGPAEEVERWCRLLETVDQTLVPGWPAVAERLRATEPEPAARPAIVHGDFRLGNLLTEGPEVRAVIDWEIWSVGDPRVDLGWFLANADPATYRRGTRYESLVPTGQELTDVYAAGYGSEPAEVGWFRALACFKSTATWSLIVKHNRRRPAPDPEMEAMAAVLPDLLDQAGRLLS